jgi:hypothetical protein
MCAMWVPVPPAVGHNIDCLLWDTVPNGVKTLPSLSLPMISYTDLLLCYLPWMPYREGAAHVLFLPRCPTGGAGAARVPMHFYDTLFLI